jgi:hypothetical protein
MPVCCASLSIWWPPERLPLTVSAVLRWPAWSACCAPYRTTPAALSAGVSSLSTLGWQLRAYQVSMAGCMLIYMRTSPNNSSPSQSRTLTRIAACVVYAALAPHPRPPWRDVCASHRKYATTACISAYDGTGAAPTVAIACARTGFQPPHRRERAWADPETLRMDHSASSPPPSRRGRLRAGIATGPSRRRQGPAILGDT